MQIKTIEDGLRLGKEKLVALGKTVSFRADLLDWIEENMNRVSSDREVKELECGTCEGSGVLISRPRSRGRLHPSSFKPDACLQKHWYDLIDDGDEVEERGNFEAETLMIFQTGHWVHDGLQGFAAKMYGDTFEAEVPARIDDYFISGSADGERTVPQLRYGFEFKTIKEQRFNELTGVKEDHIWQGTVYMKALDLPVMLFIYFNKNNSHLLEFVSPFNPAVWEEIEETLITPVLEAGNDGPGAVTPRGREVTKWTCRDCGYNHGCPLSKFKPGRRRRKR